MSEKFRIDRKIGFQNTFNTKCINVKSDSIGPSIILRSIFALSGIERENYNDYLLFIIYILSVLQVFIS